jgi:endonuclease-3
MARAYREGRPPYDPDMPPKRRRETSEARRERARAVLALLREAIADARCALDHRDPWQLLVATILSAQCTDARVNQVTPPLFARWPTPAALASAPRGEVEEAVRSTGFFRNKAKNLQGAAARVAGAFGGQVPRSMEDLTSLPGVARKTANVVRGVSWGLADGVVVDTHVRRLSRRLGFTRQGDPVRIERELMALFPREDWIDLGHLLIHHGRRTCAARRPRCDECPVAALCPSAK